VGQGQAQFPVEFGPIGRLGIPDHGSGNCTSRSSGVAQDDPCATDARGEYSDNLPL
jgi:hypothetical protein